MPRPRLACPKYLRHKASGRAYSKTGARKVWFGKYGTPESKELYRQFLADLSAAATAAPVPPPAPLAARPLVSEVVVGFLERCLGQYSKSEAAHYRAAVGVLITSAGGMDATEFGPRALSDVRDAMVAKGWTREHVNAQVRRVRAVFRWAETLELVPRGTWRGLQSLAGLKAGTVASQRVVQPADDGAVERTLRFLSPTVAGMVRFQRLTGCRPQDVCNLHPDRIDRSDEVWVYRPEQHKGAWRGQSREVYIGPKAQEVIAGRLDGGHVFSPRRAWQEESDRRRAGGKGRKAGWVDRGPPARVSGSYGTRAYDLAIERAVDRANASAAADGVAEIPHWRPNQLRHAAGTEFREKFGLDVAQKLMGHKNARTTERYAKPVDRAAVDAAGQVG
jgi:integrase